MTASFLKLKPRLQWNGWEKGVCGYGVCVASTVVKQMKQAQMQIRDKALNNEYKGVKPSPTAGGSTSCNQEERWHRAFCLVSSTRSK